MWKIFSVPCGSALYKFHCTSDNEKGKTGIVNLMLSLLAIKANSSGAIVLLLI
jgi:hypothetical protein